MMLGVTHQIPSVGSYIYIYIELYTHCFQIRISCMLLFPPSYPLPAEFKHVRAAHKD